MINTFKTLTRGCTLRRSRVYPTSNALPAHSQLLAPLHFRGWHVTMRVDTLRSDAVGPRGAEAIPVVWIIEEGSVHAAVERTLTDPAWPADKAGQFPKTLTRRFSPDAKLVEWVPIDRDVVARWAALPALAGRYVYESRSLAKHSAPHEQAEFRVEFSEAFRGVISADDAGRLRRVLEQETPERRVLNIEQHCLPAVYCGHRLEDGARCGNRLFPGHRGPTLPDANPAADSNDGLIAPADPLRDESADAGDDLVELPSHAIHSYFSDVCSLMGHPSAVPGVIDRVVLDTIRELVTPEALTVSITHAQLEADTHLAERANLERDLALAERMRDAAADEVLRAKIEDRVDDVTYWRTKEASHATTARQLRIKVDTVVSDAERLRTLGADDIARIVALGSDLDELLDQVSAHPAVSRRLLQELGVTIFAHTPGKYACDLEVQFPTGVCAQRWVFAQPLPCAQAARVFCDVQWTQGADLGTVAASLKRMIGGQNSGRWTARRVQGAALRHRHLEDEPCRDGEHATLDVWAQRLDTTVNDVLRRAVRGELGPARAGSGDAPTCLLLAPHEEELHRAYPDYACSAVAVGAGWLLEDTVRLAQAARDLWVSPESFFDVAKSMQDYSMFAKDLAGRTYVHFPTVRRPGHEAAIHDAFAQRPDLVVLPRECWFPESELSDRACWPLVERLAPRVLLPSLKGVARPWLWLGPSVRSDVARSSLVTEVAASPHAHLPVAEFHPCDAALQHFIDRGLAYPKRSAWLRAIMPEDSHIPQVTAFGEAYGLRWMRYVHIPAQVWATSDPVAIKTWLTGRPPVRKLERAARRSLRARVAAEQEQRALRVREQAQAPSAQLAEAST